MARSRSLAGVQDVYQLGDDLLLKYRMLTTHRTYADHLSKLGIKSYNCI